MIATTHIHIYVGLSPCPVFQLPRKGKGSSPPSEEKATVTRSRPGREGREVVVGSPFRKGQASNDIFLLSLPCLPSLSHPMHVRRRSRKVTREKTGSWRVFSSLFPCKVLSILPGGRPFLSMLQCACRRSVCRPKSVSTGPLSLPPPSPPKAAAMLWRQVRAMLPPCE